MKDDDDNNQSVNIAVQKIALMRRELAERFTVKRIGLFGSFARGEARAESDVDIVVDLAEPTFDHYMDLKFRLEEALERPVDLVIAGTVKPRLKAILTGGDLCVEIRWTAVNLKSLLAV